MSDTATPSEPQSNLDKLVSAVVRGIISAKVSTLPDEHKARWSANTAMAEELEQEMAPLARAVIGDLGNLDNLPEGFRALLDEAGDPGHQFGWWVQIMLFIGNVFGTIPALLQIGSQVSRNELWQHNPTVPLSPADLADAVMRNIMELAPAKVAASMSGVPGDNFETMVALVGEPPGPVDMLSLWRRGLMSEPELEHTIRYSRIRNEFIPFVKLLAHSYMSPTDVIELRVKGLVTDEEGRTMFGIAGGLESQWEQLWQAAGNAIGAVEAMNLWNHKLIDETKVDEILGRTRINPIFYDVAKLQRHKWLGLFQVGRALTAGSVDAPTATKWLLEDGYPPDQVHAYVKGATAGKVTKHKLETEGLVVQQYIDHLFTSSEAIAALAQLGYDATEADLILRNADARRADSQLTSAVTKVRRAYIAKRLTRAQAQHDLDLLAVPTAASDQWLVAWGVERDTTFRELTPAQVGSMLKKGILNEHEAITRWVAMGYTGADAQLLAEEYGAPRPKA